ncbi:DUF2161 family putative PD-(D/E)XK-type phosphodiesterase [Oceanirhabdus sp. W0125-5]|uniref:DUF2161 family putative PD-(D/E)XK-type phosphodiesterase n=1 Tax=Oceanirhabdus sp. W0125-5 TaxID=2999116 RepID=UPI0022F33E32|nr:DUF2161 family putative PD-(D/E)XK-type phosphodiesterase [Oceanirhabdus sp. W0125-5]WBW94726.1 DUF2161 family putative PD-(D/E)XK-type phosphodiesterase [Oceanirhabdus sp. W0125-5]
MNNILKESDMYIPLKNFLEKQGFSVKGEVKECDIVGERDGQVVIVEMKKSLNFKLLLQGSLRQKISDNVYLAIEKPKKSHYTKEWNDKKYLLKRLELGLIFVKKDKVEVIIEPKEYNLKTVRNRNKKKRESLIKEFNNRGGDFNWGGVSKSKIVTAYREETIRIAHYVNENGEISIKELLKLGCTEKTSSILQKNFYDWFIRVKRGTYSLTDKGKRAVIDYEDVIKNIKEKEIEESI